MKHLILICCLAGFSIQEQEKLPMGDNGLVTFEEVVEVPKMPKGLLFENAKAWIKSYYKSPRAIKAEDAMEGTISVVSMFRIMSEPQGTKPGGVINYSLDIKVKEGKYKYTISNLRHTDKSQAIGSGGKLERSEPHCGLKEMKLEQWSGIKTQAKEGVEKIIADFKKGMSYTSPDESDKF